MQREYRHTSIRFDEHAAQALAAALFGRLESLTWRYHGIGVLQAYLLEAEPPGVEHRVHIWHPELSRPELAAQGNVHNHRFDMVSTVLYGEVYHAEYELCGGFDWLRYEVVHARESPQAYQPPQRVDAPSVDVRVATGKILRGATYTFPAGHFHATRVDGLAITFVTKRNQANVRAEVLLPVDAEPLHGFSFAPAPTAKVREIVRAATSALERQARGRR